MTRSSNRGVLRFTDAGSQQVIRPGETHASIVVVFTVAPGMTARQSARCSPLGQVVQRAPSTGRHCSPTAGSTTGSLTACPSTSPTRRWTSPRRRRPTMRWSCWGWLLQLPGQLCGDRVERRPGPGGVHARRDPRPRQRRHDRAGHARQRPGRRRHAGDQPHRQPAAPWWPSPGSAADVAIVPRGDASLPRGRRVLDRCRR